MLSLDFICQHPEIVREGLRRRHEPQTIDDILSLAALKRELAMRCAALYSALEQLKEASRTASSVQLVDFTAQTRTLSQQIRQLEYQMGDLDTRQQPLLLNLPNLPHESVQEGGGETGKRELRRWGESLTFAFDPQNHRDLGERLHLIDFESGARVAGSRFVALKGVGARLERAFISFMLDVHTQEHNYTEWMLPTLAKRSVMVGAGQLPRYEEQVYVCPEDELYLSSTSEVALIGMYSDSTLPAESLPLRSVACTTVFRREVGATSRQSRGLLRLRQFHQVELFQIVTPQDSYTILEQMLGHAEAILRQLELPYRVVALSASNLPFAAAKTLDLEVWMPAMRRYIAISSVSNYEAFQARRANIQYRPTNSSHGEYVHTLSASTLAVSRLMAAILEAYQQANGTVIIPKVLRPYMGASLLSP